jgi:hypothetical protein
MAQINTNPVASVFLPDFFRSASPSWSGRTWFAPPAAMTWKIKAIHAPNAFDQAEKENRPDTE